MRALYVCSLVLALATAVVRAQIAPDPPAIAITTSVRAFQPGELIVANLSIGGEPTSARISVFGRTIPAYRTDAAGWQALIGIDLDQKPGPYTLTAEAQAGAVMLRESVEVVVRPKTFATRTLRVAPTYVNPPAAEQRRIEREAVFLRDVYANSAAERLWLGPFVRPVPDKANSRFGSRSIFNGQPRSPHAGTDFLSGAGTPVKAPAGGRIVAARDLFFTGNTVVIDHGLGLVSIFAHLSRIDVKEGETIDAARVIGLVGATGRVTGPHLHWSLRVGGARVDPLAALELLGDPVASASR